MFRYFLVLSVLSILFFISCESNTSSEAPSYTPCSNGKSEVYECKNIDLYAHVDISELSGDELSDIW
ncbi:MAG: hypothetical protein RI575_09150 [Balneolaceae bacterium]|nr:hypothetical protein [Balneolaceae bacterium]